MKITYEVLADDGEQATVRITPQSPLNGFHGCDLAVSRQEHESESEFILNRVTWKLSQEVGAETFATSCVLEKV